MNHFMLYGRYYALHFIKKTWIINNLFKTKQYSNYESIDSPTFLFINKQLAVAVKWWIDIKKYNQNLVSF